MEAIEAAPFSALQACKVLGLSADRFYRWRMRESLVDKPPIAKLAPHKLLKEEQEEIVSYSFGIDSKLARIRIRRLKKMAAEDIVNIRGTLLMLDNVTPHVAVPIQAIQNEKVIVTTLSDKRGKYQFINLKQGCYQVRCHVLGGYVYYSEGGNAVKDESRAASLQVKHGVVCDSIDFRLAPLKKGTWKNLTYMDGLANSHVTSILCEPDGEMWFGTLDGISRYDGRSFSNFTTRDGLASQIVRVIYGAPESVLWFATHSGVSRYDGEGFVNFTTENGLVHNRVISIHLDQAGLLWFGTEGGGVACYDGTVWTSLDIRDGLASNTVPFICHHVDGSLWFATEGRVTYYRRSIVSPKARVTSVTTDRIYHDLHAIPAFIPGTRITIEYDSIDLKTVPEKRQYRCRIYKAEKISSDVPYNHPTRDTTFNLQNPDPPIDMKSGCLPQWETITAN